MAAVLSFEAAAKAYKMAKAKEKLVDANTQLANAQVEAGSFYNAANSLAAAAETQVELGNVAAATPLFEEACQRYREGSSEKMAALVLEKAGKALVKVDQAAAEGFFDRCLERFEDGEELLHSRSAFDYIIAHYISNENWPKAFETLERQIDMGIAIDAQAISCKAALTQVVIYLATDRYMEAAERENELRSGKIETWLQCSERKYLRSAMMGWELGNQEHFDKAVKDVALCLTGQMTRILKKLVVPEEGVDMDEMMEPEPEGDEDDDDPDGIC